MDLSEVTYEAPNSAGADAEMSEGGLASTSQEREWPLLYRATDNNGDKSKKLKLSTVVRKQTILCPSLPLPTPPKLTTPLRAPSQVNPADLAAFASSTTAALRQSITFLRPKKKKHVKKTAAPASRSAAAPAPTFSRLPRLAGPKRGAGAHKRQRLKKRRTRQLVKLAARRKRDRP